MKHTYKHLSEVKKKMHLVVYTINTLPQTHLARNALALVTRRGKANASYKIYISKFCSGHSFAMHELGHIIYQHLRFEETVQSQVYERLKGAWNEFSKYVSFNSRTEKHAMDSLVRLLLNYAMDMEVNSKVFDADERESLIEDMTRAEYRRLSFLVEHQVYGCAEARKRLARFEYARMQDKKAFLATPVFAENYGFPRGLSWLQYIDLIIMRPDTVMAQISEKFRREQGDLLEKDKKIPCKIVVQAADTSDISAELTSEVLQSESEKDAFCRCGKTQNFTVHKLGSEVRNFIVGRAIDTFDDARTDYLYLANRGRTDNILRGKTLSHSDYMPGNIYVIVDTSGSVQEERLAQLLSLFSEIKEMVGSQSKVIFWDSDLQRIDSLCYGIEDIPLGSGTNIAPALAYTASRYCRENDRVFIVSDYFDSLDDWLSEVKKIRSGIGCSFCGICWTKKSDLDFLNKTDLRSFCNEVETLFVEY